MRIPQVRFLKELTLNVTWRKVNLLMKHVRKFGRRYVFLFMLGMITEIYLNSPLECACVTIILIGYFLNILPHKNIGIVIYVVTFILKSRGKFNLRA